MTGNTKENTEMTTIRMNDFFSFVEQNRELIDQIKVTNLKQYAFNNMEGWQYDINVKVMTINGYKNKLIQIATNSTYLDELEVINKKSLSEEFSCWFNL